MTPEQRREYNRKYYDEHREGILEKALKKVKCEFCGRNVIKNNIFLHYKLPICKRRTEERYRRELKQQFELIDNNFTENNL